jgi:hypothetical protein
VLRRRPHAFPIAATARAADGNLGVGPRVFNDMSQSLRAIVEETREQLREIEGRRRRIFCSSDDGRLGMKQASLAAETVAEVKVL